MELEVKMIIAEAKNIIKNKSAICKKYKKECDNCPLKMESGREEVDNDLCDAIYDLEKIIEENEE